MQLLMIKKILLSPVRENLQINGKLVYNEHSQSWGIIRLKKEILHEYPQLKEKRGKFSYVMIIPKSFKDIKKFVKEYEDNQKAVPLLLFFSKEKFKESV